MAPYEQPHRDCGGHGCVWCEGKGFIVGNGEAGALRGQLHDVQGLVGRATIVPEEAFADVRRGRKHRVTVSPEAA